jgi:hypothetical protein
MRLARSALTLALALFGMVVVPVGAEAHKAHKRIVQHPTTDPVTLALTAAEHYWGGAPCGGAITLKATTAPSLQQLPSQEGNAEGGTVAAWTVWSGESPSTYADCVITFNSHTWPDWKAMDENYQEYCDEMTHEVGHLFGHEDEATTDPESIEYPILGYENFNSVAECRGVTLYYGYEVFRVETQTEEECETRRREAAELVGKETWASCER